MVDIKGRKLVQADCPEDVIIPASPGPQPAFKSVSFLSALQAVQDLLQKYPDILSSDGFSASKPRHGVQPHLLTQPGPPVFEKPRRLDQEKLAAAQKEFSTMEKAGIIRRLSSPWSSPLHNVQKKDRGWRPCGDYRRLNNITILDRYPLPNIDDFTSQIAGSTIFSRLDLQKGYYQILMAPEDVPKTAIITPFGQMRVRHPETEFLGHRLTSSGLHPLPNHTSAIRDYPPPTDKPGLQRFLSMINFYCRFFRSAAQVLAALTNALKGPGKSLQWNPTLDYALSDAKLLLSTIPVLTHPFLGRPCLWRSTSLTPTLVPSCNNASMGPGLPLLSSPRNYPLLNPSTPPLIVNSSQLTPPFAISVSSSKPVNLPFSPIISLLP